MAYLDVHLVDLLSIILNAQFSESRDPSFELDI